MRWIALCKHLCLCNDPHSSCIPLNPVTTADGYRAEPNDGRAGMAGAARQQRRDAARGAHVGVDVAHARWP